MNTRSLSTIILAVVLIVLVMGVTGFLTASGGLNNARFDAQAGWSRGFSSAQTMKVVPLADKSRIVVVQNETTVSAFDVSGAPVYSKTFRGPLVTTFSDINGDGADETLVLSPDAGGIVITALGPKGEELKKWAVAQTNAPARAAVVRFASGPQIVVGDDRGALVALTLDGREAWRAKLSRGGAVDTIRGEDEIKVDGAYYLAAANHDGAVALYDGTGKTKWTYTMGEALRRLRAYDLKGNGKGQIILGGDSSNLVMLDASNGQVLFTKSTGQAVTEVREVEVDGNPSTREFVAGGKKGGVWALTADGKELWSSTVSDKVNEIAGVDVDNDGADEVVIGDDGGGAYLFAGKSGSRTDLPSRKTGILRIDAARLTGSDQIVVADGTSVTLFTLTRTVAPIWYSPLTAGLLVSLVIAVLAWFVATMPPKPTLKVTVADQSPEGMQSRLRMLHEDIADLERLKKAGDMDPKAYLERLKDLRGELADTQAALIKAGVKVTVETQKCPNCGGSIPLGTDKCEYCGAVVIR
ncbi:MAG: PQQ-like beta-propeller repeat protein [Chloroflexi bacterium]|nr:PQQ-like beta-propeller repeat protein [Chloroflexota bacterium]